MRAVVRVRREVAEARRVRKCMVVGGSGLFRNGWMGWCEEVFFFWDGLAEMVWMVASVWWQLSDQEGKEADEAMM
jgi:hypothetical protein